MYLWWACIAGVLAEADCLGERAGSIGGHPWQAERTGSAHIIDGILP